MHRVAISVGLGLTAVLLTATVAFAGENRIQDIEVEEGPNNTVISIVGTTTPTFTVFKLLDPVRLLVDITDGNMNTSAGLTTVRNGVVHDIGTLTFKSHGRQIGRVVIGFDREAPYTVKADGNRIRVVIDGTDRTLPKLDEKRAQEALERVRTALASEKELLLKLALARERAQRLHASKNQLVGKTSRLEAALKLAQVEIDRLRGLVASRVSNEQKADALIQQAAEKAAQKKAALEQAARLTQERLKVLEAQANKVALERDAAHRAIAIAEKRRTSLQKALQLEESRRDAAVRTRRAQEMLAQKATSQRQAEERRATLLTEARKADAVRQESLKDLRVKAKRFQGDARKAKQNLMLIQARLKTIRAQLKASSTTQRVRIKVLERQLVKRVKTHKNTLKGLKYSIAALETTATKAEQAYVRISDSLALAEEKLSAVNAQKDKAERRHNKVAARAASLAKQLRLALQQVTAQEKVRVQAENTVARLRTERIEDEERVIDLQAQYEELQETAARLAKEKKALENAVSAHDRQKQVRKQNLVKLLENQKAEMSALQKRIAGVETEGKELERELKTQQEKVVRVRDQLDREKSDLAAVLRQKALFVREAEELRLQNLSARKNLNVVRNDVSNAEFVLDRLTDEREQTQQHVLDLTKTVTTLESRIGAGNDIASLRRLSQIKKQEIASLRAALAERDATQAPVDTEADKRLQAALAKARFQAKKTRQGRKKLKELEKVLRAQRTEITGLKSTKTRTLLAQREEELKQLKSALLWLEETNKTTLSLSRLHDQKLRKQLKSERRATASLKKKLKSARTNLAKSDRQLASLQTKLRAELSRQQRLAEQRIRSLEEKLAAASDRQAVRTLKDQLAEARKALVAQQNRQASSDRKLVEVKRQAAANLSNARKANAALKAELSDVRTSLTALKQQERQTIDRVAALEERLLRARKDGSETNELTQDLAVARGKLTRVVAELKKEHVQSQKAKGTTASATPVKPTATTPSKKKKPLVRVTNVTFGEKKQVAYVTIALDGNPSYSIADQSDNRVVLILRDTRIPKMLERRLDTRDFYGPVQMVSSYADPSSPNRVRVVVHLNEHVKNRVRRDGNILRWEFVDNQPNGEPTRTAGQERSPVRVTSAGSLVQYEPTMVGAERVESPPEGLVIPGGGMDFGVLNPVHRVRQRRRYKGPRISLSIKDADIQEVLAFLAEQGGVNIITGESVSGSTTMHLKDVPWELALDLVLKSKGLDYVLESGVYRVAPIEAIQKEFEQQVEKRKKLAELKRLVVKLVVVNYASAKDLEARVKDILSEKGSVSTDARTNTLIIKDIEEHVVAAEDLVRRLDTQTPQVLIEARIVEASSNFSEELGIQWGGNYTAAPAFGNETGLLFPGIIGLAGAADDSASPTTGLLNDAPNFAVNLPAAVGGGKGGGIGLTLGSVSGAGSLSLRLTAAEERGQVKIISSPRIATLDNKEATITQGISIPISVVSSLGVNTQFFNAELQLKVLPHVTQDGNVNLSVDISKNEPNFGQRGASGNPTIERKEAHTQLLVRDGDTAVIGGIYTRNTASSYAKIPILGDIPVIGWLFKSRVKSDKRTELLLFITPRIVNRSASRVRVD
jgi:type IV pilus assembly protein PilQ